MKIRLNGSDYETEAGSVAALIAALGIPPQTALVECNGEALVRGTWEARALAEGDRVEILRVAAGG